MRRNITVPEHSDEVIVICRSLIGGTRMDDIKYDAYRIPAETYQKIGEYALARDTIEQIPELYFTKLELTARLLEGEDILQTARIYSGVSGKVPGWRSAVGLHCKFNRCAV